MILVRLSGGLGNQMFQYAVGRALAEKHKAVLKLDLTLLNERKNIPANQVFREYDLDVFSMEQNFATQEEVEYFNPVSKNIFSRINYRIRRKLRPKELYIARFRHFDPAVLELPDDVCLVGSWQSEKYFNSISQIIRRDFTFRKEFDAETEKLAARILSGNSVCINFRRTDYVSNPLYKELLGAMDIEFYNKAIQYIRDRVKDLVLFVFSDDLEWCKQNMKFDLPVTFVTEEFYGEKYSFKLKLMSLCAHFIIPNSTFGWWAAWLGTNPDKLVVAPQRWYKDTSFDSKDIVPDKWIKL